MRQDRSRASFLELRHDTVRKVPEVPATRAHKAPRPARSARFGPDTRSKYTLQASIAPPFDRLGIWASLEVGKDTHFQLLRYLLLAHIAPAQLALKHSSNCAGETSRTPPI